MYHGWGCILIYRPMSYPFRSLLAATHTDTHTRTRAQPYILIKTYQHILESSSVRKRISKKCFKAAYWIYYFLDVAPDFMYSNKIILTVG